MDKKISICGLDCGPCPAHIAYATNDQALREKTALEWSRDYGADIAPERVNCVGCTTLEGVHIGHCFECAIRKCGLEKKMANCGVCADYGCAIVGPFLEKVSQAKANLEGIRAALPR
jgi:hypothetical protein